MLSAIISRFSGTLWNPLVPFEVHFSPIKDINIASFLLSEQNRISEVIFASQVYCSAIHYLKYFNIRKTRSHKETSSIPAKVKKSTDILQSNEEMLIMFFALDSGRDIRQSKTRNSDCKTKEPNTMRFKRSNIVKWREAYPAGENT